MVNVIFLELGLIIIVATTLAFVAKKFKQPLIPAYIVAGLLLGPGLYNLLRIPKIQAAFNISDTFSLISNLELIQTFSEIGIAFLLFLVGMEIEFGRLKDVEFVSSIGTILQVAIIFPIGFFLATLLGFSAIEAVYLGFILVFSSTMVVLKILSDKRELDTLHGRIVIGILLVQDVIAMFALLILTTINTPSIIDFLIHISKGTIVLLITVFLGNLLFPYISAFAAKGREVLFLFSLTVCFLFALVFEASGFSLAIGAFIGGVLLGNLHYTTEIVARIMPLRDFFSTLFFVSLGIQLHFVEFGKLIVPVFLFGIAVLFLKPLIVITITALFGYTKKVAYSTGVTLGQVSEFSLILVANGLAAGVIGSNIFFLTTMLAIISIPSTSYVLKYEKHIYNFLQKDLGIFDKIGGIKRHPETFMSNPNPEVILCGYNRAAYSIFRKLTKLKKKFLVIDYNPQVIKTLVQKKISAIFGDISNIEVLDEIPFKKAKIVVSTVPDEHASRLLIRKAKRTNKKILVIVTASHLDEALGLYNSGADYVVLPHYLSGEHISLLLDDVEANLKNIKRKKDHHLLELQKRKLLGHDRARLYMHEPKEHL